MSESTYATAILAGGQARRLGGIDKATLLVGGTRIIDRQVTILRQVTGRLHLVTSEPGRHAHLGLPLVTDRVHKKGALGGLYTAIVTSPTERTLVVACDLPFLTVPFLRHLLHLSEGVDAVVPRTLDGYHPLCAVYSHRCAAPIRRRLDAGTLRVIDALADLDVREVEPNEVATFDAHGALLLNVNTPDDHEHADQVARAMREE